MKNRIILAISTLIIIIGIVFFATKTDKQEFISYIIRDDIWHVLEEKYIEKYAEKQKQTPYMNKGQIEVITDGLEVETLGMIKDINWTFEGKTKKVENKIEQDITFEDNSTMKFRQDNQKIGILTEMLGSKFVVIENENLKELVQKFGFNGTTIPDKIDLENLKITEKESNKLKSKYVKILNSHISKDQFSKEKLDNQNIISFNISEQKIAEIIKNILRELRDDEIIFTKITDENLKTDIQKEIDLLIKDIDSLKINPNNKCIIKLYIKKNDIKKYEIIFAEGDLEISKTTIENADNQITIKTYQNNNLLLEGNLLKQKDKNDVNYDISIKAYIEGQKNEFILKAQYKNLLKLDNVQEIYEIKVSYEDQNQYGNLQNTADLMSVNINYSNQKTFDNDLDIEEFNKENAIILNTATDKDIQSIIKSIFKNIDLF